MECVLNKLYCDGDSFSTLLPQGQSVTTAHIVAQRLGLELDHYGHPGKNPQKIIRSSMRYSFDNTDSFMLIGIGSIWRLEKHTDEVLPFEYPHNFFVSEHSVAPMQVNAFNRDHAELFHFQYMQTQILFNLIALHDYLLYNNCKFLIHNLGEDFDHDEDFAFSQGIREQITARPRIANFYENSLHSLMREHNCVPWDYDEYGWIGHPDEQGHAMYADFLMEHIDE